MGYLHKLGMGKTLSLGVGVQTGFRHLHSLPAQDVFTMLPEALQGLLARLVPSCLCCSPLYQSKLLKALNYDSIGNAVQLFAFELVSSYQ